MAGLSALQNRLNQVDEEKRKARQVQRRERDIQHAKYLKNTGDSVQVNGLKEGMSAVQAKMLKRFTILMLPSLLFICFRLVGPLITEYFPGAAKIVNAVDAAPTSMSDLEATVSNALEGI